MDTTDGATGGTGIDQGNVQQPSAAHSGVSRGRRRRVVVLSAALAATVVAGATAGVAANGFASRSAAAASTSSTSANIHNALGPGSYGYGGYGSGGYGGYGGYASGGYGSGGYGSSSGSTGSAALASATPAEEVGVVDITSELTYQQAESAGTGLVLTSDGEILTNNHVVAGATSISVTVVSTGATFTATVVGTDATDDIAVLHLSNASGLSTAHLDTSNSPAVGDAVTGVGNAGGTGGTPSASPGTVTALDQTITTQAEGSAASETLNGLIETDADIQAGDSGGPLFNSADQVIGIDTAAASGGATPAGYAIPIRSALAVAGEIVAGHASSTVTIGYPAFLGVEVGSSADGTAAATPGAAIAGVIDGSPAATAGLAAGDTITALNGTTIDSQQALTATLQTLAPGQRVSIAWTDQSGASQSAPITLASGPVA
ncbi:trypsin-like serine protease [Diaminobutyricibacter tongyongensis]|uniref:Trypsin-like serine protease n=1 Tax=Leifsonia tongyongensis TaxID=1268043 RepID=A0A6L9XSG7_9MICO|nr:trypsin-like peptidase domain-containing protein [Diaminobutyricibacter tongyongensis]NEN04352.1 trypsin-like serine protease [Diaminobutyricibacter tongyongensis]